jgi:pyruvate formate-lyase/glycerol dehydratase family glycyl radical enzyme
MTKVTLDDVSLSRIESLDQYEDLKNLKKAYSNAVPEICVERPRLITEFHLEKGLFDQIHVEEGSIDQGRISILDKARAYRHVLENRTAVVRHTHAHDKNMYEFSLKDTSPFAGSTTSRFKGVPLYPELIGLFLWPELKSMRRRDLNPFYITSEEANELNLKIFPHWMKKNVVEITRYRDYKEQFHVPNPPDSHDELKLLQNWVFFLTSKPLCISHTIPDFSKAVRSGLLSMIEEAADKQSGTDDPSKIEFYSAIIEVLSGIINYSNRLAQEAIRLAGLASDPLEKDRLNEIATTYSKVPEAGADTFREALTTVWICWTAMHLENPNVGLSLGRLDQLLYPYYREDIDHDRLTPEKAVELLCYLWLKIGDHVPTMTETGEQLFGGTGSNQAVTIGGVDANGDDAVNDVTYLILKATELMLLRDPNLNARYHPDKSSDEYLKRISEVNITTKATPAIHNDKAVIKALVSKDKDNSEEQARDYARDYGIVGCVEPVSAGRTYGHPAAVLINLVSALELALFDGKHRYTGMDKQIGPKTGGAASFGSFDDFWAAFRTQTHWLIDRATILNDKFGKTHQDFYPTPILSAFFEGPMDKGKDLIQGGATINSSGAAIIGLAVVVDSLCAINKWVFNKEYMPFSRLLDALRNDFVGDEPLRLLLANPEKTPKYGNEHPDADAIATKVVTMLDDAFRTRQNYRGGKYRVGYWTMTLHAGLGRFTGSLPNGRKARENYASGITPVSGVARDLSKILNSVAKLPAEALSSGVALNITYPPEPHFESMQDHFAATVKAFFNGVGGNGDGGFEIQFNVRSRDEFERAMEDPEKYGDFLVRVSGYTAYFKDLNPQMQREIMERTEYLLSTGNAQPSKPVDI